MVVLEINKAQRHIRGGMATKLKYKKHTDCEESQNTYMKTAGTKCIRCQLFLFYIYATNYMQFK